jgi:hypothetical protein
MLKKVVLAVGLIAIPSIAPAQQQQCQLECTWAMRSCNIKASARCLTPLCRTMSVRQRNSEAKLGLNYLFCAY